MRGGVIPELATLVTESILMREYHQQYSELDAMPIETVIFLLRLLENQQLYEKQEYEKASKKGRRR